jgi:hypothetical protein
LFVNWTVNSSFSRLYHAAERQLEPRNFISSLAFRLDCGLAFRSGCRVLLSEPVAIRAFLSAMISPPIDMTSGQAPLRIA